MLIGQAATATGVSVKMIRHYEAIGLIPSAERRSGNYRTYDEADLHRLAFIRRARDLGFSIDRIRALLRLWSDRDRASAEVKAIAAEHVAELERRIAAMRDMTTELHRLADACRGDDGSDCPILTSLECGRVPAPEKVGKRRPRLLAGAREANSAVAR